MSPSEFELRDALHHGEDDAGGVLNVSAIIANAESIRARRVRYRSAAAAAVLVVGAITGITVASTSSSKNHQTASGDALQRATVPKSNEGGGAVAAPANGYSSAPSCADNPPVRSVPIASGRSGSFFTKPVVSFEVCSYRTGGKGSLASVILSGQDAAAVARSLDSADTVQHIVPCPLQPAQILLTLQPVYADGSRPPVIVANVQAPCALPTTNGVVVRYAWVPPPALDPFLQAARAAALTQSGTVTGSPIHS